MNHPITDALTGDESRHCAAIVKHAIEQFAQDGDRQALGRALDRFDELTEFYAHGVPDDSDWPDAKQEANTAISRSRDNVLWIDGRTTGEWAEITGLHASTIRKRYRDGKRGKALLGPLECVA